MGRSRYKILDEHYPYFITSSLVGKLPLFTDQKINSIITDGLRFLIQKRNIKVYAYVIMPDHFHAIIHFSQIEDAPRTKTNTFGPQQNNLASLIRGFKSSATSNIKSISSYFQWQKGYHDRILFYEKDLTNAIAYIQANPIKEWIKMNSK